MRLQQTRDRRSTDASTSTEAISGCGTWTVFGFCGDDTSAFVVLALLVGLLLALALLVRWRLRVRRSRRGQAHRRRSSAMPILPSSNTSPPPYTTALGFGCEHDYGYDSLSKSSPVRPSNPALDPFHVVPTSFDRSFLLEDPDDGVLPSKPQRGHIHSGSDSDSEHTQNQDRHCASPTTPTSPYTPTSSYPHTPPVPPPAYAYDGAGAGQSR